MTKETYAGTAGQQHSDPETFRLDCHLVLPVCLFRRYSVLLLHDECLLRQG